ncbi:uncharacterized protein [Nicotiana sylvestris]|uniref:uncharacterized protein n=1 Tax=Nicotiana sylvestris TaxID=4096 RepID=UPI00388CE838
MADTSSAWQSGANVPQGDPTIIHLHKELHDHGQAIAELTTTMNQLGALPSDTVVNPKGGNGGDHKKWRGGEVNTSKQKVVVSDEVEVQDDDVPIVDEQVSEENLNAEVRIYIHDNEVETQDDVNPSREHVIDIPEMVIVDDTSAMINVEDPLETVLLNFDVNEDEGRVDTTLEVLQRRKKAIGWTLAYIRGISPTFCMHKIIFKDDAKPSVEHQRMLNDAMQEVVKKEGGMNVVTNEQNELIPTKIVIGWRVCMDYQKLNKVTQDHFPLPFHDQMLNRLTWCAFYCFLDGYPGYNKILIAPEDQEKTTFTCLYGTFAFSRMQFGLCNAPSTF